MRPEAVPGLRRLTDAIHAEGAAISAQIGHAGPVANARSNRAKALAPVRFFNPCHAFQRPTRDDIDDVIERHANAARFAIDAGFDAVEIHLGHNYFAARSSARCSTGATTSSAAHWRTARRWRAAWCWRCARR